MIEQVEESKGLEFEDVCIFNFFSDSPADKEGGAVHGDPEATAAAPAHAAEAKQPIEPCAARCVQSAIGAKAMRPRPVGKNALHWAMVEGLQSEQKPLLSQRLALVALPLRPLITTVPASM